MNGVLKKGDKNKVLFQQAEYFADEVGILKLGLAPRSEVRSAGDVGYIITGIKNAKEVKDRRYDHPGFMIPIRK